METEIERYKYKEGDRLGPFNTLLIKRLDKTSPKDPHKFGIFKCSFCDDGYFEARISSVVDGSVKSCGCFHKKQATKNGEKRFKDLNNQNFGFLIAIRPLPKDNPNESYTWECICNSPFHLNPQICYVKANLLLEGKVKSCGCLKGKNLFRSHSLGEDKIRDILQKLNIDYIQEHVFTDCINPKTGQHLRFDFYLPQYHTCIEYDGEQHFSYTSRGFFTESTYNDIQFRDRIKDNYCKTHNIVLIRIPYTDKEKINSNYILSRLSDDRRIDEV